MTRYVRDDYWICYYYLNITMKQDDNKGIHSKILRKEILNQNDLFPLLFRLL